LNRLPGFAKIFRQYPPHLRSDSDEEAVALFSICLKHLPRFLNFVGVDVDEEISVFHAVNTGFPCFHGFSGDLDCIDGRCGDSEGWTMSGDVRIRSIGR